MRKSELMSFGSLLKTDEQEVTMLVCEPEIRDLQNEVFSAGVIEEMQQGYSKFRHWGVQHRDKEGLLYDVLNLDKEEIWQDSYDDDFSLLDSFIVPSDSVVNGHPIRQGSWIATAKVHNKDIWEKIKSGELGGVSVGGLKIGMPENSHERITSAVVAELSLCVSPANQRPFLLLKNMDPWFRPYPNFHSCSVRPKDQFQKDSFRTIESKRGINLIVARPIGSQKTALQSIRYPISNFSENTARDHCGKYKNSKFEPAREEE